MLMLIIGRHGLGLADFDQIVARLDLRHRQAIMATSRLAMVSFDYRKLEAYAYVAYGARVVTTCGTDRRR